MAGYSHQNQNVLAVSVCLINATKYSSRTEEENPIHSTTKNQQKVSKDLV